MNQIKQFKEFTTGNKIRDIVCTQMAPTVQKLENQWKKIRGQVDDFKERYQILMRFDSQKSALQNNIKQVRTQSNNMRTSLTVLKSEVEINQTKNSATYSTFNEELMSFQRTLTRRDETLLNYDKKINYLADGFAKTQNYITQRLGVFEQKYKKLTKQTLQMTKDMKKEFQSSFTSNQVLKSQLCYKMKLMEEKENILNLYLAQREENTNKFMQLFEQVKNKVKQTQFQEYKKIHQGYLHDYEKKVQRQLENLIPHDAKLHLTNISLKYAQIQDLKEKFSRIQHLKVQIQTISEQIKGRQQLEDQKLQKIRVETEQIQEKIIQVIDKKMETLQENLQEHIQASENLQDKLKIFQIEFQQKINERLNEEIKRLQKLKEVTITNPSPLQSQPISKQLNFAKEERRKIENYGSDIKKIAEGLQDKLNLFSNRITVCRSDVQLFVQNTKKELKKINTLKQVQQSQTEQIGKLMSQFLETFMILTSLHLHQESLNTKNTFVTFKDGIIYESKNQENQQNAIFYRRNMFKVSQLKQSLLYSLVNLTDDLILNYPYLKIHLHKPSQFFTALKSNFQQREKIAHRSTSLLIHSSRKTIRKLQEQQGNMLDYRRQSEQLFSRCETSKKSGITITNGNLPWPLEKFNSAMQRRYKGRKSHLKAKNQTEQRNCITASRSHRKTKIQFN